MATKYRVGPRPVSGVAPGGVLELGEGTPLNVPALVKSGHLTPIRNVPPPETPRPGRKDTKQEKGEGA